MPKRADISSILVIGAALGLSAPASAQDSAWAVAPPSNGSATMSRTVDNVTLNYKRSPSDDDTLRLTVRGCGDTPWYMESGLEQVSAESLREAVAEQFDNARLNCKLADGVEERVMAGFDEAFAKVKPFLPPHTATVGGWQLSDVGSMPGDDSEREVSLTRTLDGLKMSYEPSANDRAGLNFKCDGSSYGTGFDFGNPPEDHLKAITGEVTEAYADLNQDCKSKPPAQAALMQGFPEALATLEGWLKAKPFVYLPETPAEQEK